MNIKRQPMPPSVPPAVIPPYCEHFKTLESISAAQFLHMFVHIWTTDNDQFWMYVTQADAAQLIGYIWQENGWYFTQVPYDTIDNMR